MPFLEIPPCRVPKVDRERVSDDEFIADLVEGANLANQYLATSAAIVPTLALSDLESGILIGHMVRLFKLHDSFLLLITKNRGEPAFILIRPLVETIINLRFLLRHRSEELLTAYQRASLAYEKKLWEEIESRKQEPVMPMEQRMLDSISDTFSRAGVAIEEVSWKDRHWGGDASQKALLTDLVELYEFAFRTASNFVHGTWHDLEFHHLLRKGAKYYPALEYTVPVPQIMADPILMSLVVAGEYAEHVCGESASELVKAMRQLEEWFVDMVEQHEAFLQKR